MSWLMLLILALIIIIAVAAIPVFKVNREEYRRTGQHPKGHYLGLGMAFGIAFGLPMGIAIGNIALGPAMGLPIGLAIGAAWEKQHEDELRPRTEREERMQRFVLAGLIVLLIAGVAAGLFAWLLAADAMTAASGCLDAPQHGNCGHERYRSAIAYGFFALRSSDREPLLRSASASMASARCASAM